MSGTREASATLLRTAGATTDHEITTADAVASLTRARRKFIYDAIPATVCSSRRSGASHWGLLRDEICDVKRRFVGLWSPTDVALSLRDAGDSAQAADLSVPVCVRSRFEDWRSRPVTCH